MPSNAAPADDPFSAAFGGGAPASAPVDDAFSAAFAPPAPKNEAPAAAAGPSRGEKVLAGVTQGVRDVTASLGKAASFLDRVTGKGKLDAALGLTNPADIVADTLARTKEAETKYGDSGYFTAGRLGGNVVASVPALMAGSAAAAPVAEAVGGALPAGVLRFVSGSRYGSDLATLASKGTNLLLKGGEGAIQGAYGNALIGGTSDVPLADQMESGAKMGAALGVAVPVVRGTARYLGGVANALVSPFTEAGQQQLARKAIDRFAGGQVTPNMLTIVPGSEPTLAEVTGNAGVAGLQRTMRDLQPQSFVDREIANAAARTDLLHTAAGTPQDIAAAAAKRATQADKALTQVFADAQPADVAPAVKAIDDILGGSSGKRDAVRSVLTNIRSKLVDANGNLETDARTVYDSVRKQIGDFLDKKAAMSNPAGQQAARELLAVRDQLDEVLKTAAPGFDKYLADYAAASKPIDAMEFLQGLNLTDARGNITLAKVQNALTSVGKLQRAEGTNPAKALTPDQVNVLRGLRDDLLRQQNTALGKSLGSNSVQNIAGQNLLSSLLPGKLGVFAGRLSPEVLGGAIGGAVGTGVGFPGTGVAAGVGAGRMLQGIMESKNAAVRQKIEQMLLHPEVYAAASAPRIPSRALALRNGLLGAASAPASVPVGVIVGNRLLQAPAGPALIQAP